jgi:hypothetical protein
MGLLGSLLALFTCVGALIGHRKGRLLEGVIAGLMLGPIGLFWIAFAEAKAVCPECGGFTVKDARKCRHCGSSLTRNPLQFRDERLDPLYRSNNGVAEDPEFDEEMAELLKDVPATKSKTRPRQ